MKKLILIFLANLVMLFSICSVEISAGDIEIRKIFEGESTRVCVPTPQYLDALLGKIGQKKKELRAAR